jgi:thiosulfate reductase cytochrome b subunit
MRHPAAVRVTHWLTVASVAALVVSGIAILLAHPRFYWGETGSVGMPALFELPLPFVLTGQTGWGRSLHFQSAWAIVLTGMVYVARGIRNGHFRFTDYSHRQRLAYRAVVFVLVPLMIWTGLAMSPAIVSVAPPIVEVLGGHQSARTIHFLAAILLVLFVAGHVAMVAIGGFTAHVMAMITGRPRPQEETV